MAKLRRAGATMRRNHWVRVMHRVLDLFSAAAGGWTLGLHEAGFVTVAACEAVAWRRAIYAENNPGIPIYDDVNTLTGERIQRDLGFLPDVVVGSPPCQDISAANAAGQGVDGARSGLFFQATRIVGEVRPRWVALENSSNLRTRGADRVLGELEALGYTCEAFVVGADDIGADHERKRSWIVGFDPEQVANTARLGRQGRRSWRRRKDGDNAPPVVPGVLGDAPGDAPGDGRATGGQGGRADSDARLQVEAYQGLAPGSVDSGPPGLPWSNWNGGIAGHLRVDDGLSAWLAGTRVPVGGKRGTSASALLVEAYGDAVVPQIPEAIGRAILRVEAAMAALLGAAA